MKPTFLTYERPLLTCMVLADNPTRTQELMKRAHPLGAEAFGMQIDKMKLEYRSKSVYREMFKCAEGKPVYVTNYRRSRNEGRADEALADELIELAECGATLCDVMGDLYDRQPDELAVDKTAVKKQMKLIDDLHKMGAEVLMSSHVFRFTPAQRVLEMALEHQRRGADICKIVVGASSMAEQIENLRIIDLLKQNLKIPFLFLSGGESSIMRKIGGALGCCMYLCVVEHDEFSITTQPLLSDVKLLRDII